MCHLAQGDHSPAIVKLPHLFPTLHCTPTYAAWSYVEHIIIVSANSRLQKCSQWFIKLQMFKTGETTRQYKLSNSLLNIGLVQTWS